MGRLPEGVWGKSLGKVGEEDSREATKVSREAAKGAKVEEKLSHQRMTVKNTV